MIEASLDSLLTMSMHGGVPNTRIKAIGRFLGLPLGSIQPAVTDNHEWVQRSRTGQGEINGVAMIQHGGSTAVSDPACRRKRGGASTEINSPAFRRSERFTQ